MAVMALGAGPARAARSCRRRCSAPGSTSSTATCQHHRGQRVRQGHARARCCSAGSYPQLPPEGKPAFCFYPMSKRREAHANWYATPYEERNEMMMEHGTSGRKFAGRVVQLVTGSTGLDDFEWGVTLFADDPDVIKDVVYTMRFDRGCALYGEFGRSTSATSTTSRTLV